MNTADILRDIFDDPNNDEPRLVFADWLEEDGQVDRAEWIRTSCRIEKLPMGDEWDRLVDKRIELFARCRPDYWESITGVSDLDRRGLFMMETYKSPTATQRLGKVMWLDQAREDGWLEGLHIKNIASVEILKVWKQPALNCRLFLNPVPQVTDDDLSGLLGMPNLTGIALSHRMYEECKSIRSLNSATKLEKLILEELRDDEFSKAVLDQVPDLSELRQLELNGTNRPTDDDVGAFLRLTKLKELKIKSNEITDDFVTELQKIPSLRDLTLSCSQISNGSVAELRIARPDMNVTVWN